MNRYASETCHHCNGIGGRVIGEYRVTMRTTTDSGTRGHAVQVKLLCKKCREWHENCSAVTDLTATEAMIAADGPDGYKGAM